MRKIPANILNSALLWAIFGYLTRAESYSTRAYWLMVGVIINVICDIVFVIVDRIGGAE